MPIPIDKLKKNIELDEDHKAVYDFFKTHTEYAYSESEIIQELNDYIFNKEFNKSKCNREKSDRIQ